MVQKTKVCVAFCLGSHLFSSAGLALESEKHSEKRAKVKWKNVQELAEEPTGCEFLENIEGDGEGVFVFTKKQSQKKMNKRAQHAAAAAGGNAFHMTKTTHHQGGRWTFEAKTYWCDSLP